MKQMVKWNFFPILMVRVEKTVQEIFKKMPNKKYKIKDENNIFLSRRPITIIAQPYLFCLKMKLRLYQADT